MLCRLFCPRKSGGFDCDDSINSWQFGRLVCYVKPNQCLVEQKLESEEILSRQREVVPYISEGQFVDVFVNQEAVQLLGVVLVLGHKVKDLC